MDKNLVRLAQRQLNERYDLSLVIDGIIGENTTSAILMTPTISPMWSEERIVVGYLQHICTMEDINAGPIDGLWGPQTEYGVEQLKIKLEKGKKPDPWRDDEGIGGNPNVGKWPLQTQDELENFYGKVGTNQTSVRVPYTLKLAWDTDVKVNKVTCHQKVADAFVAVLEDVKETYGLDEIQRLGLDLFGGMLNVRKMRGGTKWSTHSWGVAADFSPQENRLKWDHTRAAFARPEYDEWNAAWERQGAVSLGKSRDYDWMHYQFCRVS